MTPADGFRAAARYLDECLTCGKQHEPRPVTAWSTAITWEDPEDHHPLRRRGDSRTVRLLLEQADALEKEKTRV